jgi:hypothetical protein
MEMELCAALFVAEQSNGDKPVAVNKPVGDNARKGAVHKRSQLKTKIQGEEHWTKRSRTSGRFMDQKEGEAKFKGVRRERRA